MRWWDSFAKPESIAIIGASANIESLSGRPLHILGQHHFRGRIYLVNPNRSEIHGFATYPTIQHVPEAVDLAVIALPAHLVLEVLGECARVGVRNVLIFSSGFAETEGPNAETESKLRDICARTGIRIAGPNSQGYVNLWDDVAIGFSPALDYQRGLAEPLRRGAIAVISQSGGLGFAILAEGQARGLGFSYVFTTGNESDLDAADYLEGCLMDSRTDIVAMLVESFKNSRRFLEVAERGAAANKLIVAAKVGRSNAGRRAVLSHSAHLAGNHVAYSAAFRKAGVLEVEDPDELIDVLMAVRTLPPLVGDRVGVFTVSGGAGAWLADALEESDFEVPELDDNAVDAVLSVLPRNASGRNPVDTTAQVVEHGGLAAAITSLLDLEYIDAVAIAFSLAVPDLLEREEEELRSVFLRSRKPIVVYAYTPPTERAVKTLERTGIPWFPTAIRTARALRATRALARLHGAESTSIFRASEDSVEPGSRTDTPHPTHAGRKILCEYEVKDALRAAGIATPREILVTSEIDAARAAEKIGGSVALKVQSPEIMHKNRAGGVVLGVSGSDAVAREYRRLLEQVQRKVPDAEVRGVLVQEMVRPGIEMMVGRTEDQDFGPLVLVAQGGVNVEVLRDSVCALAPVGQDDAMAMIRSLRCWRELSGSTTIADLQALASLVSRLSDGSLWLQGRLLELDLNPVMLYTSGDGICVVDAKGVMEEEPNDDV